MKIQFPDTPIIDPWRPTYLPAKELAACGHYGCPTYRCFYDGLCEHNWGDDNDCRLPIDKDGWGNYCTFHGEVELARAAREYGEDNVCMTDQQRAERTRTTGCVCESDDTCPDACVCLVCHEILDDLVEEEDVPYEDN